MDEFVDHIKYSRRNKFVTKLGKPTKSFLRMKTLNGANDFQSNSLIGHADIEYSINKKQRWNLVDSFRTNMGSLKFDDDIRISALEYHTIPGKENLLKAFHSLDENGGEIHKYTKKGYANEKSMNGETSKNSKRKKNTQNLKIDEEENSPQIPHIRYEILSQAPHYNKKKKKGNRSNVKLSMNLIDDGYSNYHFGSSQDEISENDEFAEYSSEIRPLSVVDCYTMLNSSKRVKCQSHKSKSVKSKFNHFDKPWIRQISTFGEFLPKNTVQAVIESTEAPIATGVVSFPSNFEIIPIELMCLTENLNSDFLMESFGENYMECSCYPRRFLVDFSNDFIQKATHLNPDIILKEVKTLITFEILDENEVDDGVSLVGISLNANVTKDDGSLSLDSLNPCMIHSVADIVRGAITSLCTLHLYSFMEAKVWSPADPLSAKLPLLKINPAQYVSSKDSFLSLGCQRSNCKELEAGNVAGSSPKRVENCSICFMDEKGFRLNECGHYFCNFCWKDYCLEKISSNHCPITCPQSKCSTSVNYWLLTTFLPLPKCDLYSNQLRNLHILRQIGQWYWCPTKNCQLLRFAQPTSISSFHCLCGASWCKECSNEAHWPLSCESIKRYVFKLNQNGHDYIPWFYQKEEEKFVKVKKCPICKQNVEKVDGCDYINCICSNSFCWRCLKPWNHGSDHFGCKEPTVEHEEIELVDDGSKKSDNFLRKTLYSRALKHRTANFPPQAHSFRKRLMKRKDSFRFQCGELSTLIKLRNQCHLILEYIYVWVGTECKDKIFGLHIQQISHRLEFYLYLIENIYDEKGYQKIVSLLNEIENISDSLISKIVLKLKDN